MKYKKYSKFRHFIRDKILLPIANRLIDIRPRFVHVIRDGVRYEARYYRTRYWYDNERITIRGILNKRKVYHVSYWDGGEKGNVWCQMFGRGQDMFYVERKYDIESMVSNELGRVVDSWLKYVVKPNKEKKA